MTATFAFGDARTETWGAGRVPATGTSATMVVAAGQRTATLAASAPTPRSGEPWELGGDDFALTLLPSGRGLCRAAGCFTLAGTRHRFDCPGWLASEEPFAGTEWESLRQVAVWFSCEEGLLLVALRPPGAGGHAEDLITAEIFGEEDRIEDPRLSTTYDRDGRVMRAGLELWLGEPEGEEHHALRAAGEGVGAPAGWREPRASFAARLMRWHSRGREGTGVYLLGRRR
jgi:hypothetical protein